MDAGNLGGAAAAVNKTITLFGLENIQANAVWQIVDDGGATIVSYTVVNPAIEDLTTIAAALAQQLDERRRLHGERKWRRDHADR